MVVICDNMGCPKGRMLGIGRRHKWRVWGTGCHQCTLSLWGMGCHQCTLSLWGMGCHQCTLSLWGMGCHLLFLLLLRSNLESKLYVWGSPFWVSLCVSDLFFQKSNHRGSHILSLWMVHVRCVFLLPAFTCLGHECQYLWVRVRECMCAQRRPWFTLSSKRVFGNEVRTHINSKGKIPCTRGSEEGRTHDAASRRTVSPTHYQLNYSGPYGLSPIWFVFWPHLMPLVHHLPKWPKLNAVCLLVGCLTSQQQASVSQGRICSDNFTCCHTEIEVADPTFYLTQSQYTDTGPTSPSADPITPGAWQGSHWSANF